MKFASFEIQTPLGAATRVGVLHGEKLLDINTVYRAYLRDKLEVFNWAELADAVQPTDMLAYIRGGKVCRKATEEAVAYFEELGCPASGREQYLYEPGAVKFLAPVPNPVSLRDFSAYVEHILSSRPDVPEVMKRRPPCYRGSTTNCVGSGEELVWYAGSDFMDYELEIAIVIGKYGSEIKAENALDHVFGLMNFLDFTSRDVQVDERPLGLGPNKSKSFHKSNVFGPFLTTIDEFPDVHDINMEIRVNGKVLGSGNTRDMTYFTIPKLVEYASVCDELYPGEILGTGTHGGCAGHEIGNKLRPGDEIEITIDKMGTLKAKVGPYIDGERIVVPEHLRH